MLKDFAQYIADGKIPASATISIMIEGTAVRISIRAPKGKSMISFVHHAPIEKLMTLLDSVKYDKQILLAFIKEYNE